MTLLITNMAAMSGYQNQSCGSSTFLYEKRPFVPIDLHGSWCAKC